jgi:hypothetical protein
MYLSERGNGTYFEREGPRYVTERLNPPHTNLQPKYLNKYQRLNSTDWMRGGFLPHIKQTVLPRVCLLLESPNLAAISYSWSGVGVGGGGWGCGPWVLIS